MVTCTQVTAVDSFPQVTVLPRRAGGVLAGSSLDKICELGISRVFIGIWLIWVYQILHKSIASSEINIKLFKRL